MNEPFGQEFWDDRYRQREAVWSGEPNPQLVAETAGLEPGSALDVGSGEGADAVWLANRGWAVTAVDFSAEALARAAAHAVQGALAGGITWAQHDITIWEPPAGAFDLVSAQFMQLPADHRLRLHRRLASAVAPGGTLLVVGHHPTDLGLNVRRPSRPDVLFTADDVADAVGGSGWETLTCEARPRIQPDADGNPVQVHDTVFCARRRA